MAVYTVTLNNVTGPDVVTLTDGSTYATLEVSAGRGPKGDGWTGGSYSESTGVVTFTSNDGLGFATGDLRPDLSEPDPIGDVTPNTGAFTSLSTTGDTVIGGDLTVNGTTTTVNTQTLDVADKNITVAYGAADPASANGGGLTVDGADATLTYQSAGDNWALNKDLSVSGDITLTGTVDGRDVAADGSVIDGLGTISTQDNDSVDINGGSIDGAVIGGSSAAAITGTTGQFNTSLNVDGTVAAQAANITGTVTADGLTVDGEIGLTVGNTIGAGLGYAGNTSSAGAGKIDFYDTSTGALVIDGFGPAYLANSGVKIRQSGQDALWVQPNGDISFYEDTGTTPKFFWDASAESLGIGTSSPSMGVDIVAANNSQLKIDSSDANDTTFFLDYNGGGATNRIRVRNAAGDLAFNVSNTTEAMRIDSAGRVGIGTSSPAAKLDVKASSGTLLKAENIGVAQLNIGTNGTSTNYYDGNTQIFRSGNGGSEAMRIDSSGNLLVGKAAINTNVVGVEFKSAGQVLSTADGTNPLLLNRKTSDGEIARFQKDGSTVGSIGYQGQLVIHNSNMGVGFSNDDLRAVDGSGSNADNAYDLGHSTVRWDDVYATNGTIQTSDRNEKQDIEALSDAEQRVAVACKGLLRKFRWKSAVEEKGDDARIHFGIIAQDLQAAFEAEGLDAGRYAMFIHSTWVDEETGEERSRMGVRYSELLAFIIAAI